MVGENSHSILRCSMHLDPEDDSGLLIKRGDASVPSDLPKRQKSKFYVKIKIQTIQMERWPRALGNVDIKDVVCIILVLFLYLSDRSFLIIHWPD